MRALARLIRGEHKSFGEGRGWERLRIAAYLQALARLIRGEHKSFGAGRRLGAAQDRGVSAGLGGRDWRRTQEFRRGAWLGVAQDCGRSEGSWRTLRAPFVASTRFFARRDGAGCGDGLGDWQNVGPRKSRRRA